MSAAAIMQQAAAAVPMLEARGVSRQFGTSFALRDVSLCVMPGESHALVGRNGAGKSTLVSYGARFIILDEPTAQLDGEEIRRLFRRVADLQREGVTFLFISHHLEEIYEICQTVTVLRDARHIVTAPVAAMPKDKLIEAMTGERGGLALADPRKRPSVARAPVVLQLEQLGGEGFRDVSLQVRAGEAVGLTGATSSGHTGVGESVAGLRRPDAGCIRVHGLPLPPGDVAQALARGVGCVPKERHREGLVLGQSIAENATMTIPHRLGRFGFLSTARKRSLALDMMRALAVAACDEAQPVGGLSGGNQQKVVMARAGQRSRGAGADRPHRGRGREVAPGPAGGGRAAAPGGQGSAAGQQ